MPIQDYLIVHLTVKIKRSRAVVLNVRNMPHGWGFDFQVSENIQFSVLSLIIIGIIIKI